MYAVVGAIQLQTIHRKLIWMDNSSLLLLLLFPPKITKNILPDLYRLFSLVTPIIQTVTPPLTLAYVPADPNSSFDNMGRCHAVTAAADLCSAADVVLA